MTRFERITFTDANEKRVSTFIKIIRESDKLLVGYAVDKEGEDTAPKGYDRNLLAIGKTDIKKRVEYVMDFKFGWLVRKGTESQRVK